MRFHSLPTALLLLAAAVEAQWPPPEPCIGDCNTHDPSLIRHTNGTYFLFGSGDHLALSESLTGPWTYIPAALSSLGIAQKAPDVHLVNGTYYMFYQYLIQGDNIQSNISVATSPSMATGSWTNHGNLTIPLPNTVPDPSKPGSYYDYNRIDANFLVDSVGNYYLSFGSYWQDIFQVRMADPPTQIIPNTMKHLEMNLTSHLPKGENPSEGSFQFRYKTNGTEFYYLFFSSGYCCGNQPVPKGDEYKIMVCRSEGPSGPFVDKNGTSCLEKGGTQIYGSMDFGAQGSIYAPGGEGVMYDETVDGGSVILYYHYIANATSTAPAARFGWNKLDFGGDGWPFVTTLSKS